MMSELLMLKGLLSDLPVEQQQKIKEITEEFKNKIKEEGENGLLAFTMAALELQEKA